MIDSTSVLVTGGAGFIGSNLVHRLVGDGHHVTVLDDLSTGRLANLDGLEDKITLIEGSIEDPHTCARACHGTRVVFHQAALPSVPRSLANPVASHEVNATGTLNVLQAARESGVRRFVYAGSSSAYGNTQELPKREDQHGVPRSPYAVAKLTGEHYVRVYASAYGMETVVLRYFNIFGPRQDPDSPYSALIPLLIRHAQAGTSPTIHGDGEQTRDFTFIGNAVHANLLAASADPSDVSGQTFNVGCGDRTSVNELWRLVQDLIGVDIPAIHAAPRTGDVRDSLASLELAQARLGYQAQFSLREGLERTIAFGADPGRQNRSVSRDPTA